jgi:DNA-binding NarL/FixJ family response regulator
MSSKREETAAKARNPKRVLICNQYTLFRDGIKALLQEASTIKIVGEASTARQALQLLKHTRPDVVLMDAAMPDLTGCEATKRIKAKVPGVNVLILTLYDDECMIARCLEAGACGYIRKNDQSLQLKKAINRACGKGDRAA